MINRRTLWVSLLLLFFISLFSNVKKVYDGFDPNRYLLSSDFIGEKSIHIVLVKEGLFSADEVRVIGEYLLFENPDGIVGFDLNQVLVEEYYEINIVGIRFNVFFRGPVLRKEFNDYIYLRDVAVEKHEEL